MRASHLMWVFAGLFLVCGMPLFFVETESWKRIWAGLSAMFLGSFALAFACDAVGRGRLKLQHSLVERSKQPRLFWAGVSVIAAAGFGVLVSAFWIAFVKG